VPPRISDIYTGLAVFWCLQQIYLSEGNAAMVSVTKETASINALDDVFKALSDSDSNSLNGHHSQRLHDQKMVRDGKITLNFIGF
jgi:hypothetical protein